MGTSKKLELFDKIQDLGKKLPTLYKPNKIKAFCFIELLFFQNAVFRKKELFLEIHL
jgi:hypothetical protein